MLQTVETLQSEPIVNQENSSQQWQHQLENSGLALELFGIELLIEPVNEADSVDVETDVKDENILEMNIKVIETIDNDTSTENESIPILTSIKEDYQERPIEESVGENELEEFENSNFHQEYKSEELLDVIEIMEPNEVPYTSTENESIPILNSIKEDYQERSIEEPVGENELEESENSTYHQEYKSEELLDVIEIMERNEMVLGEITLTEPHTFSTQIESNLEILAKMEEATDKQDGTNQEKTEEHNTENTDLTIELDNIDIEAMSEPVIEIDNCNVKIVMENEEVLEMNIKVEESTTKTLDKELITLIFNDDEKKGNHECADLNASAEIIEVQDASAVELKKNEKSFELLNGVTEIDPLKEPVTKFEMVNLQPEQKSLEDIEKEAMTQQEQVSEIDQVEIAKEPGALVAFIPKRLDEPIEFIDSETLEVSQNNEQHTPMSEETVKEASFPLNGEKLISDGKSPTQLDDLKVELVPIVPPHPLQSLGASSPQLVSESVGNVNFQGVSADRIKSPRRSMIKKPEWMRKSLVRKGSVRRLFGRMKSKRFNHDPLPVTPPPEPTAPQRPLRQIIVDFLLLLFES